MKVCIDGIIQEVEPEEIVIEPTIEPTIEERLEAVEAALLEQLLRGL